MTSMDALVIGGVVVAVIVVVAVVAYAYMKRPKKEEPDERKKISEDHIIAKMDTILRYQNVDRK